MSETNLTLYVDAQCASPYAMSAFVTLTEKGLPFALKRIDLAAGEHFSADYRRISLSRRIPTLAHHDFHLAESSAISEYLEEVFPAPAYVNVYPDTVAARAQARQIQAWLRSDLMPIREERNTEVVFFKPVSTALSEPALKAADTLFRAVDGLLGEHSNYLFGAWCIADTDLALMLNRLVLNGDAVPEKLAAYARYQWQRPAVQAWLELERQAPK